MKRARATARVLAAGGFAALLAGGCAVPATEVQVPTHSMREALELSRGTRAPLARTDAWHGPRLLPLPVPPGAPQPLLAAPDIRMAYLYEWVDAEGNRHFGNWVAIPLTGFDWVMSDGSSSALDAARGNAAGMVAAPALEAR
jgi:hypothetical protein